MEESLLGLSEVRGRVLEIASNGGDALTSSEAFFLGNVRDSVPDIMRFTAEQYDAVVRTI